AYILAQIHNFIWCKYWIFPTKKKSNTWRQVLLFSIAFGMAYGAQFLFLIGLVEGLDCNEYLAQFLGLFIYGSVNFLMNKRVTFR
ncbi:GtrA family protein, partial [uncultured Bacteroides sp.]